MSLRGFGAAPNSSMACFFATATLFLILISVHASTVAAHGHRNKNKSNGDYNAIDGCWRWNPNWGTNRQQLASCSVGFAGKMSNNIGIGLTHYQVTDSSDDPIKPKPGTLRYGATVVKGKVWITFQRNIPMHIQLKKPLLISSFTAIDGRGASVHIARGACFLLNKVNDVIIHNLRFHHCQPQGPGSVMGPDSKIQPLGPVDGDAIRLVASSKVWIDHNTLFECQDGLIDVTRGSTKITISNNWFRNHDKVMLLGHDDAFVQDRNMKVTVVYNHFGPHCYQRMPRVRHGFAHVVNNLYLGWEKYAIGGSMNPRVKSQANLFIAPKTSNKQVTWGQGGKSWNFRSVDDIFENGAHFTLTKGDHSAIKPHYNRQQRFRVADARSVRAFTRSSGALQCPRKSRC